MKVSTSAAARPFVPEVEAAIDAAWERALRRPGVHLFDGPMCRMESWRAGPDDLCLTLARTTYRAFLGTNLTNPDLADRYPAYGRSILANPVGVSPALLTADGYLMMGRRNASVAYYPGRVHPFAGALDPADDSPNDSLDDPPATDRAGPAPAPDVFAGVRRELGEELGFAAADVGEIRCTGIAEDRSICQPELIFRVRSPRTRAQIEARLDRKEHHGTWSIPATAAATEAALRDGTLLTPVAVAALLLWGRVAFGDEWFSRACGERTES